MSEVTLVLKVCDVGVIADDIAAIAKELMSGPTGILEVILKESINIFTHGHDLTADFKVMQSPFALIFHSTYLPYPLLKEAIAAWQAGDFLTSGKAIGEITGVLLED